MEINKLTKEYYENFDVEIFQHKLNFIVKKLNTLKSEKSRKKYYTELYATYLQIVEIFCINAFAVSDNELVENIFLSNFDVREKIKTRFGGETNGKNEDFISYLLNNFVFAKKDDNKDRTQQKNDYQRMVVESIDDYKNDKNFLNSYKHGFRVFSNERTSISILPANGKTAFKLQDYSSSVSYYSKECNDCPILKFTICFNWERVYVKASILINILENMKNIYLHPGEKIKFVYITFNDRQKVDSKFGCFRVHHEVDILEKQKND